MTFFIFFMLSALTYACISMYFQISVIRKTQEGISKYMLFKGDLDAAVSRLENRIVFLERAAEWDSKWLAKNFQHPAESDVPAYRIYTPLHKADEIKAAEPVDLDAFTIPDGICLGSISHPESTAECPEDINSESIETAEMEFLDEFKVGDKVWIKEGATVWNDFSYHKWPIKEEYLGMALDLVAEAGSGRVKLYASTDGGMGSLVVFAFKKSLMMAITERFKAGDKVKIKEGTLVRQDDKSWSINNQDKDTIFIVQDSLNDCYKLVAEGYDSMDSANMYGNGAIYTYEQYLILVSPEGVANV